MCLCSLLGEDKANLQQKSIKVSGRHRQTIETQQHYHRPEKNGFDTTKGAEHSAEGRSTIIQ